MARTEQLVLVFLNKAASFGSGFEALWSHRLCFSKAFSKVISFTEPLIAALIPSQPFPAPVASAAVTSSPDVHHAAALLPHSADGEWFNRPATHPSTHPSRLCSEPRAAGGGGSAETRSCSGTLHNRGGSQEGSSCTTHQRVPGGAWQRHFFSFLFTLSSHPCHRCSQVFPASTWNSTRQFAAFPAPCPGEPRWAPALPPSLLLSHSAEAPAVLSPLCPLPRPPMASPPGRCPW